MLHVGPNTLTGWRQGASGLRNWLRGLGKEEREPVRTEGWNEPPEGRFGKTRGRLASWRLLASLKQSSEFLNHQSEG